MQRPKNQTGLSPILIVMLLAVGLALAGSGYYFGKMQSSVPAVNVSNSHLPQTNSDLVASAKPLVSGGNPTLSALPSSMAKNLNKDTTHWLTYTNNKYAFKLKYPPMGILSETQQKGACGKSILEKDDENGHWVHLDDLAIILINPWRGTISEYIASQKAIGLYNIVNIDNRTADEAIMFNGLKSNNYEGGYPPLAYVQAIFKKNGNLYMFMGAQSPRAGCLMENEFDQKEPGLYKMLINHIIFTQ